MKFPIWNLARVSSYDEVFDFAYHDINFIIYRHIHLCTEINNHYTDDHSA
jgi:hypothetical protein